MMTDVSRLRARFSGVHRATVGSLAAGLWSQITLVVSGILVARLLGPTYRGYFALLILWPVVLIVLGGLGLPSAIPYFVARQPGFARAVIKRLRPIALGQVATLLLIHTSILLALIHANRLPGITFATVTMLLAVPAMLGLEYCLSITQGQRRYAAFNLLRILPTTLYSFGCVVLFVIERANLNAIALLWVGSYVVSFAVAAAVMVSRLPKANTNEGPSVGRLLRFGLTGMVGAVSPLETLRLDQAVVGLFLSPFALGLYVVALAFTNLPRFISQSVGMVAYPHVAAEGATGMKSRWRFLIFTMLVSGTAVGILVLTVGALIPALFGSQFSSAVPVARVLLIGAFFAGGRRVLADAARGSGRPLLGTIAEGLALVSLAPLLLALAPRAGILGVAFAFAISSAFSLGILLVLAANARPEAPMP